MAPVPDNLHGATYPERMPIATVVIPREAALGALTALAAKGAIAYSEWPDIRHAEAGQDAHDDPNSQPTDFLPEDEPGQ